MESTRRNDYALFMGLLPWLFVGVLVVVGGLTATVYGLPFESRDHGARTDAQLSKVGNLLEKNADQIEVLTTNQAVMQEVVRHLADQTTQLADLQKVVQAQAVHLEEQDMHIEALQADQKAESSIRAARRVR